MSNRGSATGEIRAAHIKAQIATIKHLTREVRSTRSWVQDSPSARVVSTSEIGCGLRPPRSVEVGLHAVANAPRFRLAPPVRQPRMQRRAGL